MSDERVNKTLEGCSALVASFDLVKVVVSDHAVEEPSNELSIALKVELNLFLGLIDTERDQQLNSGRGLLTGIKVVARSPVLLLFCDVCFDGHAVEEPVLRDFLGEGSGLFEDSGPVLDLLDVSTHILAASEGIWEVPNDFAKILDS